jgi:hypothetical protein
MSNWKERLQNLGLAGRTKADPVVGPAKPKNRPKAKTPGQIKKDIYNRRVARVRNLQNEIRVTRKKILFFESLGAKDKAKEALHQMISLKSKLADARSKL